MNVLINCFCANFGAGTLPSSLSIAGFSLGHGHSHFCPRPRRNSDSSDSVGCEMCRKICKSFPFPVLESSFYSQAVLSNRHCLCHDEFLRIVSQRRGWDEYVSDNPTGLLERAIAMGEDADQVLETYFGIPSSKADSFLRSIEREYYPSNEEFEESEFHYERVYSIHPDFYAVIDGLISHGFSPKKMSAEILTNCIVAPPLPRGPTLIDDGTCQWLVSRGFTFDEEKSIRVRRNEVEKLEAIVSEWE